jgi:hypothetical protein
MDEPPVQTESSVLPPATACAAVNAETRFSDQLSNVLKCADGKGLTIAQILDVMADRGHFMLLLLITLPFMLPVPTLGLSAPAGVVTCMLGFCIAVGSKPWLPQFVLKKEVSYPKLEKMVGRAMRITRWLERIVRPRMQFMVWPGARNIAGVALLSASIILSLPIPLPFANAIPATAIVLLALGYLERDGVFVILGHIVNVASWVLLFLFGEFILQTIQRFVHYVV